MTNHEGHKALWDWLAKNPRCHKVDWPGWVNVEEHAMNSCFACAEANGDCSICPINWDPDDELKSCHCEDEESPFYEWLSARNPRERSQLSAQIRDLPWNLKN